MAKKVYIGKTDNVPVYQSTNANITSSNIGTYFTVQNDTYYFVGSGSTFTSNNGGHNGASATTTLVAKQDMDVSFNYSYSSEQNYDKFYLTFGDVSVENGASGATTNKSYSGSIKSGQSIVFKYTKDNSSHGNSDKCTFSSMKVTVKTISRYEDQDLSHLIKKIYVGVGNVAKKVKKGYIGINGLAKLFYSESRPMLTPANLGLQLTRVYGYGAISACTAFNEAGFFGTYNYDTEYDDWPMINFIQLVNSSATVSVVTVTAPGYPDESMNHSSACAASENKMYFCDNFFSGNTLLSFNSSHTVSRLMTLSSGNGISECRHQMFSDFVSGVIRYCPEDDGESFTLNDSGTKQTFDAANSWNLYNYQTYMGVLLGNNLIVINNGGGKDVIAVNQSLTVTKLPDTQEGDSNVPTASIGSTSGHAIIAYRQDIDWDNDVNDDAYNMSYTHSILPQMISRYSDPGVACNVYGNAVFVGGWGSSFHGYTSALCWYDAELTVHNPGGDEYSCVGDDWNSVAYSGDYLHTSKGQKDHSKDYGPNVDIYSFKVQ